MKTPLFSTALLLSTLALAGCIVITDTSTLLPDMTIRKTVTVDMSALAEENDPETATEDMSSVCDEAKADMNIDTQVFEWISMECTQVSDYVIEMTGLVRPRDATMYTKELLPNGDMLYRYKLTQDSLNDITNQTEEESVDAEYNIASSVFHFDIFVTMPGTITSAPGATRITGNTAYYDNDAVLETFSEGVLVEALVRGSDHSATQSTNFQERVCERVARYKGRSNVYKRVQERVQRRFGFVCQ